MIWPLSNRYVKACAELREVLSQHGSPECGLAQFSLPIKCQIKFYSHHPPEGGGRSCRKRKSQMRFYEFLGCVLICMSVITLNVFQINFLTSEVGSVGEESWSGLLVFFSVSADVGGPHGGRVVIPDAGQHYHQRLDWSHTQSLERRDGRMYPHPLRAYLNSALHAPTWEKVRSSLTTEL